MRTRDGSINGLRLAGMIIIATSLLIFVALFGVNYVQSTFASNALSAVGEVIALRESCSDGCAYSPVIEFVAKDERIYSFESNYAEAPPRYPVGERLEILYNPDDPAQAEIAEMLNFWTNPIMVIFGGVDVILILVGGVLLFLSFLRR